MSGRSFKYCVCLRRSVEKLQLTIFCVPLTNRFDFTSSITGKTNLLIYCVLPANEDSSLVAFIVRTVTLSMKIALLVLCLLVFGHALPVSVSAHFTFFQEIICCLKANIRNTLSSVHKPTGESHKKVIFHMKNQKKINNRIHCFDYS